MVEPASKRRINSIAVGFDLLNALVASRAPLTLTEISRTVGMPTSQAQLYMNSFVAEGLVQQDPVSLRYRLGRFALQLGMSAIGQVEPTDLARQALIRLTEATGKNGHLSIWGDSGPIVISKSDHTRYTPLSIRIGHVLPILHSATGRVFAAHLPHRRTEAILRRECRLQPDTPYARRSAQDALWKEVRAAGYAFTQSHHNAGFAALAAPVLDYTGAPVCVVAIVGPEAGFTGANRAKLADQIAEAAASVSARLGHEATAKERVSAVCPTHPGR